MKKILVLPLFSLFLLGLTSTPLAKDNYKRNSTLPFTLIGLCGENYQFQDQRFTQVYGKREFSSVFEITGITSLDSSSYLGISTEFRHVFSRGSSSFTHQNTNITLLPFSLSAKYLYKIKNIFPYLALGGDFYYYKETSAFQHTSGWTTGYHLQGGIYYRTPLFNSIFIKIFTKFTRAVAKENELKVNLGGWELGIGFLWGFHLF